MEDQNPPTNDSLHLQAKRAQLERDHEKAIELFKSAIDSGDRVESALKDMVYLMKGLGRIDEAIETIKDNWNRNLCSPQSEDSLMNVLINLYEQTGRIDEQIELIQRKINLIEEGKAFGGTGAKTVKVGGRVVHIPIIREKSRLLGKLAWLYMLKRNYSLAEPLYREALSIERDKNKECNLAICLMYEGRRVSEARSILEAVRHSSEVEDNSSYVKSYNRACKVLMELESQSTLNYPPQFLHPPPHYFPHYPSQPFPPPQHPHHYFTPHHLPQQPQPPPHHLPQHPQPSQPFPPPPQHPHHHFTPHHLPQQPQPPPPPPPPPPHHLPQHPQPSQPPPPPPQHPPIFDVNPMVSPYDDFDNQYSFMSTFEGLEMVPWRRR